MTKKRIPIRERISTMLDNGHEDMVRLAGHANIGRQLYDIFFWQQVCDQAKNELKRSWAMAQGEEGYLDPDDDLREHGTGEHIVAESDRFSCIITVQEPRMLFDRDTFMSAICAAYKLDREALEAIAEQCKSPSRAPLEKRVVEA